ncbi:hypothetical protein FRC14_007309 [Serendipita sp. 396]|nr:hypothetical protein FRC14_007309 [Serendipita sp. 396]KAG8786537.1 hypothetical protein FRC15_011256 [Serendipita sp. 397]KAG8801168.1 hypothetical protein FRC16_001122 [Serendipita sp. 398]KAG8821241.1 hypothetical protein FRC18_011394 [Serendipita sp. 400]KAG8821714.1 hypothetical protein FRC19_007357 [Serendipita sp. 401]KAG8870834.1 hypothetical protein FRC20_011285 [Serendipita sp. 405]KAG9053966.1 hypothetical protein FS842_006602 [Serendipita sp. 407]
MSKRPASPSNSQALAKRARGTTPPSNQIAISVPANTREQALVRTVKRTSGLESPIVALNGGHTGEILSARFDPTGQNIAACSTDCSVSLWRTYAPSNNYGQLPHIHKTAITDLQWSLNSPILYTASADKTIIMSDLTTGERVKRLRGHGGIINAIARTAAGASGIELLATASDDGTVKIWEGGSEGTRYNVADWSIGCPATAVCWGPDGNSVYIGALDNLIHVYDLRKGEQVAVLGGHTDTPTSLSLSPDGSYILSPSLSSQTIIHDIRPFSPLPTRVFKVLQGAPAGFENALLRGAWSRSDGGSRVAVGGADRTVTVWDVETTKIQYKLPGHKGTVTCVDFHPKEPIILTGSKDTTLLLGELEESA